MAPPRRVGKPARAEGYQHDGGEEASERMMRLMDRMLDRMDRSEERRDRQEERMDRYEARFNRMAGGQRQDNDVHFTAFKNAEPPKFYGSHDPMVAINWLQGIERAFTVVQCTDGQKVRYASYMLKEDAESWWLGIQRARAVAQEEITWSIFSESFLKKYVPGAVRKAKDIEFLKLEQGDLSVPAYDAKFDELIKFSRLYQQNLNEAWKCSKFESSLRPEIRKVVAPMEIQDFEILVNKCRIVEDMQRDSVVKVPSSTPRVFSPRASGSNFKNKQGFKPQQHDKSFQNKNSPTACPTCKKFHGNRPCLAGKEVCYKCHQPGHFKDNCPLNASAPPAPAPAPRPQQLARVFTVNAQEATHSGLIQGDSTGTLRGN